jgi:hypothetical protein
MLACPVCGSKRVNRSKRRGIVERMFFRLVSLKPFRCEACDTRFFRSSITTPLLQPKQRH